MHRLRLALLLLVVWVLAGPARPIRAQGPMPIRDRPTLSPWLNLYRRDPGPVGPYLSNVRPEQRLLSRLSQQRIGLARQGASIRNLRSELSQTGPQTTIAATGTGATFMNHSQYFNTRGAAGSGGGARTTGSSWTPQPASRGGSSYRGL